MKNFSHEILEVLSQAEKLYTRENLWISIKFHKAEKKIFKRDGIEKENSLKYFFLFIKAFASYLNTNKLQKNVIITNIISWKWSFFFYYGFHSFWGWVQKCLFYAPHITCAINVINALSKCWK